MSVLWIKNVKFSQSFQRMYILAKKMRPTTSDNIKTELKDHIKDWKESLTQPHYFLIKYEVNTILFTTFTIITYLQISLNYNKNGQGRGNSCNYRNVFILLSTWK